MRRIKGSDRRRFRRRQMNVKRTVPAKVRFLDGRVEELELAILDISEGGVRVQLASGLPTGEFNLAIDITHLDKSLMGELILPCECVWKRHVAGSKWTYGLEFVTSQAACKVLSRVLTELTNDTRPLQEV